VTSLGEELATMKAKNASFKKKNHKRLKQMEEDYTHLREHKELLT